MHLRNVCVWCVCVRVCGVVLTAVRDHDSLTKQFEMCFAINTFFKHSDYFELWYRILRFPLQSHLMF